MKGKKILTFIIVIVAIIGIIFVGREYYYNNIYNYPKIINESLEKFYISNDNTDLIPIGDLLDLYSKNEKIVSKIKELNYNKVREWVDYLNNKYICDNKNKNSCQLYYKELLLMKTNVRKIYSSSAHELFLKDQFASLVNEIDSKTDEVNNILLDSSSNRPRNYEEIRLDKCSRKLECQECRNVMCECTYLDDNNKKETILCKVEQENK